MKHVVVNKVVEESVQDGYVQRLSKGQATGIDQLRQVLIIASLLSVVCLVWAVADWRGFHHFRWRHLLSCGVILMLHLITLICGHSRIPLNHKNGACMKGPALRVHYIVM